MSEGRWENVWHYCFLYVILEVTDGVQYRAFGSRQTSRRHRCGKTIASGECKVLRPSATIKYKGLPRLTLLLPPLLYHLHNVAIPSVNKHQTAHHSILNLGSILNFLLAFWYSRKTHLCIIIWRKSSLSFFKYWP